MPLDRPAPETCVHLGDGVYATWTGYSIELRVNDHRSDVVAELEPSSAHALSRFVTRHADWEAEAIQRAEAEAS
jgi:phosphodiesterase/alkaline phosphatase D-like protein